MFIINVNVWINIIKSNLKPNCENPMNILKYDFDFCFHKYAGLGINEVEGKSHYCRGTFHNSINATSQICSKKRNKFQMDIDQMTFNKQQRHFVASNNALCKIM